MTFVYIWAKFCGKMLKEFSKNMSLLIKFRADMVVALTSVLGLALGFRGFPPLNMSIALFVGGFLTTATAHILNQIYERKYDRLMSRTCQRPLASGRWQTKTALIFAGCFSVLGLGLLYVGVGKTSAFISLVSLLIYAFVYTPLKQKTRWAIPIGAIPGALPVLIGYVGATGKPDIFILLVFLLQFFWQLPHFWSIAWLWNDEYCKGGYDLLPTAGGRTQKNAWIIFISIFVLLPVIQLMYATGLTGPTAFLVMLVVNLWFGYRGWQFRNRPDSTNALKLMHASIFYLPLILFILFIDKL